MKRVTVFFGALALLLLADGLWMQATHYHPADQNTFFGNQNLILSDGQVILISAGLLMVATAVMWVLSVRRGRRARERTQSRGSDRSESRA